MSARARRRLVSSALRDHPVASETLRTYESVIRFKDEIITWLDTQGLYVEMEELKRMEMTPFSKVVVLFHYINGNLLKGAFSSYI